MPFSQPSPQPDFFGNMFLTTSEKVGGVVSAAMISSPLWLTQVKPYSDIAAVLDRKSTRLNSSHIPLSRMPSSA